MNDRKKKALQDLCRKNGRVFDQAADGTIYTMNQYDGTDGHFFPDISSAISWEAGYIAAGNTAGRTRQK